MEIKKVLKGEVFVTLVIMAVSLFLYEVFRVEGDFQRIVATISFFFVIPILYIRLILKRPLSEFGLQKGDWRVGMRLSLLALFILIPIFYFLFSNFNFIERYYIPVNSIASFSSFVFRELVVISFFIALYEFFFRGFIMFYFFNKIKSGLYSNIIQAVAFYAFLLMTESFGWVASPYIIVAPLAGLVAYKSRSILYSFVLSWVAILIVDTIFIKLVIDSVLGK